MKQQNSKKPKFYKNSEKKEKKPSQQVQVFPNINRVIPESLTFTRFIFNKYFLVSFISAFLGVAIALQGVDLLRHMQALREVQGKRQEIIREITYWEGVTREYQDYRDGYFRLALLEYQLGEREKAKVYVEKALIIDPNFKEGIAFRDKIGN